MFKSELGFFFDFAFAGRHMSATKRTNQCDRKGIKKDRVKSANNIDTCVDDGVLGGLAQQRLSKLSVSSYH